MTLVKRGVKGSALTHAEVDGNWDHVLDSANTVYTPPGTGAVARDVAEELDSLYVAADGFTQSTPEWIKGFQDGFADLFWSPDKALTGAVLMHYHDDVELLDLRTVGDDQFIVSRGSKGSADITVTAPSEAAQPRLVRLASGRHVARYDGTDDVLVAPAGNVGQSSFSPASDERWTFACAISLGKKAGSTAQVSFSATGLSIDTGGLAVNWGGENHPTRSPRIHLGGEFETTNWQANDEEFHVIVITWDGTTARGYIDGSAGTELDAGELTEAAHLHFGARAVGGIHSAIDEAIHVLNDRAWDTATRQAFEGWVEHHYGLDVLPSTHPYKSRAPFKAERPRLRDAQFFVGADADFPTINAALTYLDDRRPAYNFGGRNVDLIMVDGFVMAEQVYAFNGVDLSWITLRSQADEVVISREAITATMDAAGMAEETLPNFRCAFAAYNNSRLPRIGTLFDFDESGTPISHFAGIYLISGCYVTVLPGCGVKNVKKTTGKSSRGINVSGNSAADCRGSIWDGCDIGVRMSNNSVARLREAKMNNCKNGMNLGDASAVSAQDCEIKDYGSNAVNARGCKMVTLGNADLTHSDPPTGGNDEDFAVIYANDGAIVSAKGADISGARHGPFAEDGATIMIYDATATGIVGDDFKEERDGRVLRAGAVFDE